jgi:hypothetical protein
MIIGAQKAGTSSLYNYLGQHPDICTHKTLEFGFFTNDLEYDRGFDWAAGRYFYAGSPEEKALIAKSVDMMYTPLSIQRLYDHNPNVHCVVTLRNPVDRAYSAYWYARRAGAEDQKDFESACLSSARNGKSGDWRAPYVDYLNRGAYSRHLARVFQIFPEEQIHIYLLEDMIADNQSIIRSLLTITGVDPTFTPDFKQHHNRAAISRFGFAATLINARPKIRERLTIYLPAGFKDKLRSLYNKVFEREFRPPPMSAGTRAKLVEYYMPYNGELSNLIGRDLSSWNQ